MAELAKFLHYFSVVMVESAWARSKGKGLSVWFTPERPPPWYVIWSAMALSGARLARSAEQADAIIYFEDRRRGTPPALANRTALNAGCVDISKSRVAAEFETVFGYPLSLDPRRHIGIAVEKSEENGAHDGRLVQCPCAPAPERTYQRFIDCSDGEAAWDFRTTIIGRKPRFVLVKTKPAYDRFSIHNTTVDYRELSDVFDKAEIELIAKFAQKMKLDWAALDVLRDCRSGLIYVVDVNKTDIGPAVDLSSKDRSRLKRVIADAFLSLVREAKGEYASH